MATGGIKAIDEAHIRQLMDDQANALRAKDINGVMRNWAPDIVVFDVAPPRQYLGTEAYRKCLKGWFTMWKGPIECEICDLSISTKKDAGFAYSINHITGTTKDGYKPEIWVRVIACLRKINGRWKVTHEHVSVPSSQESGRAAIDLKS